jgi:Cys-tRNA synthase (O-phospho-L-seryl-tRNA:Cys-tRNA synthase)
MEKKKYPAYSIKINEEYGEILEELKAKNGVSIPVIIMLLVKGLNEGKIDLNRLIDSRK